MILRAASGALALATALSACGKHDPVDDVGIEPPSIRGTITQIQPALGGASRSIVRIEEEPTQTSGDQKAVVTVSVATALYERRGEELVRVSLADISVGQQVEAWFEGPVAESYPVQVTASRIIVVIPSGALFQTDSTAYTLRAGSGGYTTRIGVLFTNRTSGTVYFVNCNGATGVVLQKLIDGAWKQAWAPVMNECLSPPITVAAGATRSFPVHVVAAERGSNTYPQFEIDDVPGKYRIVWVHALSSYQDRLPFGDPLPVDQRVSNTFALRTGP